MLRRFLAASLAVLVVPLTPVPAAAADPGYDVERLATPEPTAKNTDHAADPDTLLVKFARGASASAKRGAVAKYSATRVTTRPGLSYELVRAPGRAKAVATSLANDDAVADVELNHIRSVTARPNDPAYTQGDQRYLRKLRLHRAWNRVKDARSQVIAVVDTGVDARHPDLSRRLVSGYNVLNPGTAPVDDNGHGTMVSGIAAAQTNNGEGIAGAAWNGRVMPIKVLDQDGNGTDWDIAEGIRVAADRGARVINLSLGGPAHSDMLREAVRYARDKGALVVAAAGNTSGNDRNYPAAYPEALAVGATDHSARLAWFSTWGNWIDVAAPGFNVVATYPGNRYVIDSGTSFAAPLVSGIASLVRAKRPRKSPGWMHWKLRRTARDAGPRGIDPYYGWGVVDAFHAVGGIATRDVNQPRLGPSEPNGVPARAVELSGSVTGTMGMAGDVDWYKIESSQVDKLKFTLTPPSYDAARPGNVDPMLAVYDSELRQLKDVDNAGPGAPESATVTVEAGTTYVAVRNFNGAPDTRSYTLTSKRTHVGMFPTKWERPTAGDTRNVEVGDVTGDGRPDVVVGSEESADGAADGGLTVFPTQADGSRGPAETYAVTSGRVAPTSSGLALLDANADGKLDVAVATWTGVEIFHQTTTGTLASAGILPETGRTGYLEARDISGNGLDDLVVSGAVDTDATRWALSVFLQQPDATFVRSEVGRALSDDVAVGDVTGDGRLDIVGFRRETVSEQYLLIHEQTADGWTFMERHTPNEGLIESIEIDDFTGDGRDDVMYVVDGGGYLRVLQQTETGELTRLPKSYTLSSSTFTTGDVNGDGRIDVVGASARGSAIVALQRADGTLGPRTFSSGGGSSPHNGLAISDLDGDGDADLAFADPRDDRVAVLYQGEPTVTPAGEREWVRSVWPFDFAPNRALSKVPAVEFERDVDPASVTGATVRLVDGQNNRTVLATVTYDATAKKATIQPEARLLEARPYRVEVKNLRDVSGAAQAEPFTTSFRTRNLAPSRVTGLVAKGRFKKAKLSWSKPDIPDFRRVLVRRKAGWQAPSRSEGKRVYSGRRNAVTAKGLRPGRTYSFSIWVQDKDGKFSRASKRRLKGTYVVAKARPRVISAGDRVKVRGKLFRSAGDKPIAGKRVVIQTRRKGTAKWYVLGRRTTSDTGYYQIVHRTKVARQYRVKFNGNRAFLGSRSPKRTVRIG
ncbi:S8 family serine peptidase [Haloechinothrix halophila]|uniref:S8 family serine peptidase n=1 Tax=Haloechinothrix halophila TaxID=1069073 RepID=UPI000408F3A9|nr:S8 family serine peptidase [Haloechinothrix halophila]